MNKISIIMGSSSDLETLQEAINFLKDFKVGFAVKVLSAHRTPKELEAYVEAAVKKGVKVFIAAAGGAAALAGVIASHTTLPVIGIPIETKSLKGLDSLLSTVQMPAGIPVATMAIGKPGAKNAAIFALEILAISDKKTQVKLARYKRDAPESKKYKNKVMSLTKVVKADPLNIKEDYIRQAAEVLGAGGLVIIPTETVYGIAANMLNEKAIKRLYEIKKRPQDKLFSIAIDNKERVSEFAREIPLSAYKLMHKFWRAR